MRTIEERYKIKDFDIIPISVDIGRKKSAFNVNQISSKGSFIDETEYYKTLNKEIKSYRRSYRLDGDRRTHTIVLYDDKINLLSDTLYGSVGHLLFFDTSENALFYYDKLTKRGLRNE